MAGSISTLMSTGVDAFTNLWDISIQFPSWVLDSDATNNFKYSARATGFNPPELSLMTGTVDYKAIQIRRPLPKIEGERHFTIDFRMDASFELYNNLLKWKHIWVDPSGESNILPGGMSGNATTDDTKYGTIEVVAYNANNSTSNYGTANNEDTRAATWTFWDVICMKVGSPNFQRSGSDFITVQADFIFGRYAEPNNNNGNAITAANNIPILTPAS